MSDESRVSKPPRPRRRRTATESLLQIVLIMDAFLVFFVTLTAFGLKALPPAQAFTGGAILIVLLAVTAGLVRYRWGIWLGWVLQAVILATGFVLPLMFLVGGGFVGLWVYCFVKARDIDRRRAAFEAQLAASEPSTESESS